MKNKLGFILIIAALLSACGHQAPQRPSQRRGETPKADSASIALMELNYQLAVAADKQLAQLAQAQNEPYALYEAGTWMRIIDRGEDTEISPLFGESWTVHMRTYDLDGKLLLDSEGYYQLGKQELPLAVEMNIGELHSGGKARLLAPWYAAYGLQGTTHVPPYTNVIIEIELK